MPAAGQIYITGGALKRTKIRSVPGTAVRPTTSMVREALFDILSGGMDGRAFLDLFAGNGTMGLEALSRGARPAVMVERLPAALDAIRYNIGKLPPEFAAETAVIASDVVAFLKKARTGADKFDIIFLDPPYYRDDRLRGFAAGLVAGVFASGLCAEGCTVVFQHETGLGLPESGPGWALFKAKQYGRTQLSFYRAAPPQ